MTHAVDATVAPFQSLDALRAAHEELLETAAASGGSSPTDATFREEMMADFISRAAATGTILDAPADRKMAQGFIDYWAASHYTSARPQAAEADMHSPNRYSRLTRLAPFDARSVEDAVRQGEQILAGLSSKDIELARRMLMHLLRLSERTGACVAVPTERHVLLAQGKLAAASTILGRLIEVGVLKQTSSDYGGVVELQYEALTRKWDRLSRWIEERKKFREAALFWDRRGRKRGALRGFGVAKEADAYSDLNELELEFLHESKKNNRVLLAVATGVVVILLTGPRLSDRLYREWWVPFRVDSVTKEVKSEQSSAQTKSEDIRWLARYDQPLQFSGIRLSGVDLSNAALQRPKFGQAVLIGTKFDNARIDFGRFDEANLARTTFVNASIHGSSFDSALLCRGVDFSNTDLRETTFVNVEFEKGTAPVVKNTAWWLANGWSWEQMEILRTQDQSELEESSAFQDIKTAAERTVQTSPADTHIRARALNLKAWYLAIFGLQLDQAESAARDALKIMTTVAKGSSQEAEVRDTLGYILLQKADKAGALEQLKIAVDLDRSPEYLFRYAVAQFASGQEADGISQLQKAMTGTDFVPNHELARLRNHISGKFEDELKAQLVARRPRPPQSPQKRECPPPLVLND
ncbi:hypothetical protein HAP41_0000004590 [Bradyrhizobium barranii subsp. apii]|uniref:Uncharacterized protein n=1 Tax=Bradyrhizobium barranii subsp. apii TaxID=2819348 RepID=A0A8T5VLV2_9BRAD|nr:pentapeptide repeat-containing protein [Bradyrhizobium barranii]UPT88417.1 hypothetical protein HAP41_0000004590 [Bradyrhizobium barranii subsp. apii]